MAALQTTVISHGTGTIKVVLFFGSEHVSRTFDTEDMWADEVREWITEEVEAHN